MNLSQLFTVLNIIFLKASCGGDDWWSQFKPNSKYGLYRAFDSDQKNINFVLLRKYYPTFFCRIYHKDKFDPIGIGTCSAAQAAGYNIELIVFKPSLPWSDPKKLISELLELTIGCGMLSITFNAGVWINVTAFDEWDKLKFWNLLTLTLVSNAMITVPKRGIYTNFYEFDEIIGVNAPNPLFPKLMWYYSHTGPGSGNETAADMRDYAPFAGYKIPSVKQFASGIKVCDTVINISVYTGPIINQTSKLLTPAELFPTNC